jgi:hypothetical protein
MPTMRLTADPPRRLSCVPSDYASRKELWIRSGLWLSFNKGPFVTLGVGNLGYAERQLLEWEKRIAAIANDERIERSLRA